MIPRRSLLKAFCASLFPASIPSFANVGPPFSFSRDTEWAALRNEPRIKRSQISGVALAKDGSVLALSRGENPWVANAGIQKRLVQSPTVLVLDPASGALNRAWGENTFVLPHQIDVDPAGNIWITDAGQNCVCKFSPEGHPLLQIGGEEAALNMPTATGFLSDGSIVVADGYRNSRVARFSPEGRLLYSWGKKGSAPREFRIPHGIAVDGADRIYIADRENKRVQITDAHGELLGLWTEVEQAVALRFVKDSIWVLSNLSAAKARILRMGVEGKLIEEFSPSPAAGWEGFESPHSIAVSPDGECVYVGFVGGKRIERYRRT